MKTRRKRLKINDYLLVRSFEMKYKHFLFLNYLEILFSSKLTRMRLNNNTKARFLLI